MTTNCEHKNIEQIGESVFCNDCEPVTYFSVTDTAKLIRTALKAAFPETKFTVRSKSYSMGASITVGYTDGPPTKAVEAITDSFSGASFDGMQDLKKFHRSILNGRPVRFAADYVFVSRRFTDLDSRKTQIESFLAQRINNYHPVSSAPFTSWAVLSTWDGRWETMERAANRFVVENAYGYQIN